MPHRTTAALLATALLLLTPALPQAKAASVDFTLEDVWRSEDDADVVWVALTNRNTTFTNVTVSLQSDGALVGTPEKFISQWDAGTRRNIYFTLVREVDTASVLLRYEAAGKTHTTTIGVAIPDRGGSGGGGAAPRVAVVDTHVDGHTLNVTIDNMGSAAAGDVFVSLEDRGVKVGAPLYRRVSSLAAGAKATVSFSLENANRTLNQITVVLEYDGRTERTTVGLSDTIGGGGNGNGDGGGGDSGENVTASVNLPYLEAEPGDTVRFTIALHNHDVERRLDLSVEHLSEGWRTTFYQGNSRISSLLMKADERRTIALEVSIPSSVDHVGASVPIVALINSDGESLARAEMSITLQGRGQLDVQVPSAFGKVAPGESATFNITVENTGTGPLRNVRVRTDLPYGWLATMTPDRIWTLEPGATRTVQVVVTAPDDAGEGQRPFDVTVSATDTDARTRTLTLDVGTPESSGALWILLVAAVLAGMAAIIVKVRRK